MSYLVMECHPGYAVVLDQQGRFLRVANQNYQVGQRVQRVIEMQPVHKENKPKLLYLRVAVAAACLCLILFGGWQMFLNPYGSVRMQINPDMNIIVNRLDCVIRVEAINGDAKVFLDGYDPDFQKIDKVTDELADRARKMGYLKTDGQIHLTVESTHENWKIATQDRLITELKVHTGGEIIVVPVTKPASPAEPTEIPTEPPTTVPTEPAKPITMDEAKAIAFKELGVTEAQLTDTDFTYEDGVYELEFTVGNMEYSVEIDGMTGAIIEIERDEEDDDDDDPDDDDDDEDDEDDD